jgi:hypothetical protein
MHFFLPCTGAWTQSLHGEPLHQPFFVMGIFEIGSHELFAQAGFELRSSWSRSPEKVGLQAWATGARLVHLSLQFVSVINKKELLPNEQ